MCLYELSKLLVFIFNFVVWAAGAVLLGVGIYLLVGDDIQDVVSIFGVDFYYTGAWILTISGGCMLIIGFCGCCGATKESPLLLKLYFCFLMVLFVLEFGIGIWALVVYDDIPSAVDDGMDSWINELSSGNASDADINSFISMQRTFDCCGGNTNTSRYDPSCSMWNDAVYDQPGVSLETALGACNCTTSDKCEVESECLNYKVYTTSCNDAIVAFVEDNITLIAALGLAFGATLVIGMLLTCYLINEIKSK